MMNDIVKIRMEMEIEGNEIDLSFGMAIQEQINEDLTEEEREEIRRLSMEISKIIGKAVRRKIDEEMEKDDKTDNLIEELMDELCDIISNKNRKDVDKFKKELDKCKTLEETSMLILDILKGK